MRRAIKISIPEPCHENWNNMTPEEKGRHCIVCKKTVLDFTKKNDEYIVQTFIENNTICGRFKSTQLERDLVLSRKAKNNYLPYVASGLFVFLGITNQNAFSQEKPNIIQTEKPQKSPIQGKIKPLKIINAKSIKGVILGQDKLPLPYVNIIIKGSLKGTTSNIDGNFNLEVNNNDMLQISYIGYKLQEIKVNDNFSEIIVLEEDDAILGGINVVVGGAIATQNYICASEELLQQRKQSTFARKNASAFYKRKQKAQRQKIKNGEIKRTTMGALLFKIKNIFKPKN